jgi:hypothetical protein
MLDMLMVHLSSIAGSLAYCGEHVGATACFVTVGIQICCIDIGMHCIYFCHISCIAFC